MWEGEREWRDVAIIPHATDDNNRARSWDEGKRVISHVIATIDIGDDSKATVALSPLHSLVDPVGRVVRICSVLCQKR